MTSNLMSMFNQYIDGTAILEGGGPCATASNFCKRWPSKEKFSIEGLKQKPIFIYHGMQDDVVDFFNATVTADWFEKLGA